MSRLKGPGHAHADLLGPLATLTSMMFMMTMPPTPRDTEAMRVRSTNVAVLILAPEFLQLVLGEEAEGSGSRQEVWRRPGGRPGSHRSKRPVPPRATGLDEVAMSSPRAKKFLR